MSNGKWKPIVFKLGSSHFTYKMELVNNQSCTNASSYLVMLQGVIQLSGLTKTWSRRTQF